VAVHDTNEGSAGRTPAEPAVDKTWSFGNSSGNGLDHGSDDGFGDGSGDGLCDGAGDGSGAHELATGRASRSRRARLAWRRWRRSRPFWGGLFIVVAGSEILASVKAPLPVVMHVGLGGLASYLVPVIMLLCGLLLWFNPDQRLFYSMIAVIMALASWVTSNLGGFFVGILFGLIGGSLAFAWAPKGRGATRKRRARRAR
jgi:hypothetical protein